MIKIEKGKFYFFKVNSFGRELEYKGKVLEFNNEEFFVRTEENCKLGFEFKNLIWIKEIKGKKLDESKVFIIRKKGSLREVEKPKF